MRARHAPGEPDPLGEGPSRLRCPVDARIVCGGSSDNGANGWLIRFGSENGLDRRIGPFKRHRKLGDLRCNVVNPLPQQRILCAFGRPRGFRLLMDEVELALSFGAFVAGYAELFFDRSLFGFQFVDNR